MSYAKLRSELLAARDRRQALLEQYLAAGLPATVTVALNLPGDEKSPAGAERLFTRTLRGLIRVLPGLVNLQTSADPLGPFGIMGVELEAAMVKELCVALEEGHPCARLVDIDVHGRNGATVGRAALGLPPRRCLICDQPAFECIRIRRHPNEQVKKKAHELLASCPS